MTEREVNTIFYRTEDLFELHTTLHEKLEPQLLNWSAKTCVGVFFVDLVSFGKGVGEKRRGGGEGRRGGEEGRGGGEGREGGGRKDGVKIAWNLYILSYVLPCQKESNFLVRVWTCSILRRFTQYR